jgi:hypothetical protein
MAKKLSARQRAKFAAGMRKDLKKLSAGGGAGG